MSALLTHIHPLVLIHRNRSLPVPGTLTVRTGQKVNALDVVAEATIPTRHYLVDVFRSLRLKTTSEADKLMERKPGDVVEKNDIIAETGGAFSRVIRTPGPGRIISTNSGKVLIEAESRELTMQAGFAGTISNIIPDRGVVIEATGALIQGVWGNGKVGQGHLNAHVAGVEGEFEPSDIVNNDREAVILADNCTSADLLKSAAESEVAGLILGSLASSLIALAESQAYPIVVLGGFGNFEMDPISRKLLVSNNGREVSLNAVKWNRLTGERPEIFIPLPADGEPYTEQANFAPGQTVRVHASAHLGKVGQVEKVFPGLMTMPGGLRCSAAAVKLINGETEIVPLNNLDIIDLNYNLPGENNEGG